MPGFVFVLRDKKRRRIFYGCRWGTVEEADRSGYVAFNMAVTFTYKKRPHTFEREILDIYETRVEMYQALQKLLDTIPDGWLGGRFYNTSKKVTPPWWLLSKDDQAKVKNKISATMRRNLQYEDIRERYAELVWPKAGRKPRKKQAE